MSVSKTGLKDLKDKIKMMSEDEIEMKKEHKKVDIAQKIIEINRQIQ